jgi:hypothetical protein
MSEDAEKLQRMMERATAAEEPSEGGLDPETASLREAWIGFGQLLDAAEASADISPLALGELPVVKAMPWPVQPRRRLVPMAALLAASLLMGIVTAWMFNSPQRLAEPSGSPEQTVSVDIESSMLPEQPREDALAADQPQWDDAFDEQIAQIDQQMVYAQQDSYSLADASGLIQYQLEQMQQDFERNEL